MSHEERSNIVAIIANVAVSLYLILTLRRLWRSGYLTGLTRW